MRELLDHIDETIIIQSECDHDKIFLFPTNKNILAFENSSVVIIAIIILITIIIIVMIEIIIVII